MQQKHHDIQRMPERYIEGDVTLKELLVFLENMQPVEQRLLAGDYLTLCDWLVKLADALDVPKEG